LATYEKVQEQRTNIAVISPVNLHVLPVILSGPLTGDLLFLPGPTTAPDDEGENNEKTIRNLGLEAAAGLHVVETKAGDNGSDDLSEPVENIVESTGAGVEMRAVEAVCGACQLSLLCVQER
jgi:hypothetical protein